ncbi:MAG: hypothetical protein JNJ61_22820 [Anaerolineae bacterium]|nr:hypothetical protein [Anaerolineae bacterium]
MENESAAAAEERETRRILRQVQDHLFSIHTGLGAVRETVGMVEVFHHPTNPLPNLNYVTPRPKTAWVSGSMVQQGLDHLSKFDRTARVQYVEGLFPPLFAKTLRDLNLKVERETPVMIYKPEGISGHIPPPLTQPHLPDGVTLEQVRDQRGIEAWWYVWRNAYFDVLTLGVEPLFVGRDTAALRLGQQLDFLLYRYGFPVGVTRVSIQGETAHILALAVLKEVRTAQMIQALQTAALAGALERKASLIFAPGETETERRLGRELGFVDFGSIVCYSGSNQAHEERHVPSMEHPVLSF